ncbi:MAG: acetyl-CoA carboxylase carboxyl transferase subunit beta, partial [Gaiellaceae bacterium]|nr:acetyl-CoA carboxylase carboxyl transferase subunit beta [Gaiellaceae bacterium]
MADRIDVSIEHKNPQPDPERKHPNTCPRCSSHFRDEELAAILYVCSHCGHHFPVKARQRIEQLTDAGSFVEEAAELRSEDPLNFVDLRPYKERLAEAELSSDSGEAMIIGQAAIEDLRDASCALITVITHPTTGGVIASYASLGDVTLAEPGAL